MADATPVVYTIASYLFLLLSAGTALAAFAKLSTTPAGILIGGGMAGHALVSIGSRLARTFAGADAGLAVGFGGSVLHLLLGIAVALGIFLLPDSLRALAKRRAPGGPPRPFA